MQSFCSDFKYDGNRDDSKKNNYLEAHKARNIACNGDCGSKIGFIINHLCTNGQVM